MKPLTRQRILAVAVFALWQWSCAPQYNSGSQQIDQYANLCNAGIPAYCIAMQQVYNQANANAMMEQSAAIAERAHWQNYWMQQQSNWNSLNAQIDNDLQANMNRLANH